MLRNLQRLLALQLLVAGFIAATHGSVSAQIAPIGPFTGEESDGFESSGTGPYVVCVPGRVLNSTADLCDSSGAAGIWIGPAASSGCQFFPHAGSLFFQCHHPCEFTFDQPAYRFGGYFGQFSGQGTAGDGVAEFYSSSNTLLWTQPFTAPANCTWNWNGWKATGIQGFSRVKLISYVTNPPFIGGLTMLDDMEVDYAPTCTIVTTYCTSKINSLGCTPSISYAGVPSFSGPDNFHVTASSVLNSKPGIMLWSLNQGAIPFFGGTLCVSAPITRTTGQSSGGTPVPAQDCTGAYSFHFSQTYMLVQLLPPSTRVYAQYWSRDPGSGPPHSANNIGLTNALTFMICP